MEKNSSPEIRNILLTFNGFQDPYNSRGKIGPVLSILEDRKGFWQKVILFFTPDMKEKAGQTCEEIREKYPETETLPVQLDLDDPTDYASVLRELRIHYTRLREDRVQYYIAVASGSAQMHACWLLLTAGGEIPARILHIREERFRKPGEDPVREINPRDRSFPVISSRISMEELPEIRPEDIDRAIQECGLIGQHPEFTKALDEAARAALTDIPVLLLGKSGTGKELFARFIQQVSKRKDKTFVAVNCPAFPKDLIESELFGHKKGAFTGAFSDKKGRLESAHGGTVFLDEIAEISPETQAKLLRFLQEKEIQVVGGDIRKTDVRVIAATNRDLDKAVQEGRVREDLCHRLTFPVFLPSLNDRRSDIPLLADYFLEKFNREHKKNAEISPEALSVLLENDWQGNIRELSGVIERTVITSRNRKILPANLHFGPLRRTDCKVAAIPEPHEGFDLKKYIDDQRRQLYLRAYEMCEGNKSAAARLLNVSSQQFGKQLKEYGIM